MYTALVLFGLRMRLYALRIRVPGKLPSLGMECWQEIIVPEASPVLRTD
jgi:hypothetical protein